MAEMLGQTEPPPDATVATTTATFATDVLAESGHRPVLVDFWAPWCEPCKQLTPVLEKAVQAAQGKVKLVTMNIDEHPQIAGQLGIRSIPAVIAFQRGQPVDGFMGALPESQVRGFIERLAGPLPEEEDLHAMADAALAAGEPLAALEIFRELREKDSGDLAALAGLIKTSVAIGELEDAQKLLAQAPATAAQDPAIAAARAAVETPRKPPISATSANLSVAWRQNPMNRRRVLNSRSRSTRKAGGTKRPMRYSQLSNATATGTTQLRGSNCCNFSRLGATWMRRPSPRGGSCRRSCFPEAVEARLEA